MQNGLDQPAYFTGRWIQAPLLCSLRKKNPTHFYSQEKDLVEKIIKRRPPTEPNQELPAYVGAKRPRSAADAGFKPRSYAPSEKISTHFPQLRERSF